MAFTHKTGASLTQWNLNALFDAAHIEETRYNFERLFGDNYRLGLLATLIPGISNSEARAWRRMVSSVLPPLMQTVLRDAIHAALTDPSGPIPIELVFGDSHGNWEVNIASTAGTKTKPEKIVITIKGIVAPFAGGGPQKEARPKKGK
jgi:hypothetical protein